MTIEEQLKELIIKKSGSVNKFSLDNGLSTSTVATVFTRGISKTNINTIIKICKALNISADELSNGRITYLSDVTYPLIEFDKLSPDNQTRLLAYYQALIDSQEKQYGKSSVEQRPQNVGYSR